MKIRNRLLPRAMLILLGAPCLLAVSGCVHPLVQMVQAFQSARKRGDVAAAQKLLAKDARSWWETKEGPGQPLKAKRSKGRWADWDQYFNAETERGPFVPAKNSVSYTTTEINDFYRLTDRAPALALYTYFFDEDGKICGKLFEPLREGRPPDRFDEAEAWIRKHDPAALAYLMPEGEILPDLTRAKRWHNLLVRWRHETGLPPIQ